MDKLAVRLEFCCTGCQPRQLTKADPGGAVVLRAIEALGESGGRNSGQARSESVCALTDQEGSSAVNGEAEEQWRQVDRGPITGDGGEEVLDMGLQAVKIPHRGTCETRTEHLARVLPRCGIVDEDTRSEERTDCVDPVSAQGPILKVDGQHVLDILGFAGDDAPVAEDDVHECGKSGLVE